MIARPPRLADWLLALRVPAEWRDYVVGDLHEEFAARSAVAPRQARRWFWRQTLRCLLTPLPSPELRPRTPDDRPARDSRCSAGPFVPTKICQVEAGSSS